MWFKHFGAGPRGAGEAYHIGIFGKTGSGKSGLAKMLLLAYARHPQMGILIIDPQGEFSNELKGTRIGQQGLDVDGVIRQSGRKILSYGITSITLSEWELLGEMLDDRRFFREICGIGTREISDVAAVRGTAALKGAKYRLDALSNVDSLTTFLGGISKDAERIYATKPRALQLQDRIAEVIAEGLDEVFKTHWKPIADLFAAGPGKKSVFGIVDDLFSGSDTQSHRPIIVIDISERGNKGIWNEDLERRLLSRLLNSLIDRSSQTLAQTEGANALVLLDEAHRHAPSGSLERGSQAEHLRSVLKRAVRETRKYGLGWMLVSQTLGGIDTEIIQQMSSMFFGFGLALGDEYRKLRELAGGDERAMELYQSFRNPQNSPRQDLREFPFMAVGPVSPLSFSGKPIFFSAFQVPKEYLEANNLAVQAGFANF